MRRAAVGRRPTALVSTAIPERRRRIGILAADPNDVSAGKDLRTLESRAVHEHTVRAEVTKLVAALDGRDLRVPPGYLVLSHDHPRARVPADHDPLIGYRVFLAVDERYESSPCGVCCSRGARPLRRQDGRDVGRRHERGVARLAIVREHKLLPRDLDFVPMNQRSRIDQRNPVHAYRGIVVRPADHHLVVVHELHDRMNAVARISVDRHVHVVARAKSILAGTK